MSSCNTVNVPGPAGQSAFTFVTANFVVPAIGSNVQIFVLDTSWMVVGENVIIGGPANFVVFTVDSPTSFTGTFLGLDGDVAVASTISLPAEVSPTGQPGLGRNAFAITTSNFTVPSVGSTVTVPVDDSGAFVVGEYVITDGPANFVVTAIGGSTSLTIKFLGNVGDVSPGATINSGSVIAPTGISGENAFTTLTAQLTIPAIGSTVTAHVVSTNWMALHQKVVIDGPASFEVTVITNSTTATLKFLGYFGDLVPTNIIANGAKVSPTGTEPPNGDSVSATIPAPFIIPVTTPTDSGISLTLPAAGTWQLTAFVHLVYSANYNGYNGENPVTITIQRLNNTTTALASLICYPTTGTNPSTASQVTWGVFPIQLAAYTTVNTNDAIGIFASYVHAITGTITIKDISFVAQQTG